MPAPLIGSAAVKADQMADARRREHNIRAAMAFRTADPADLPRPPTASGRGQVLSMPEAPFAPAPAKKADFGPLHPRAKATSFLPDNALRLYDLVLKADDANGHSKLITVDTFEVGQVLGISVTEARQARDGLQNAGLISYYDNHSGDFGWRPGA